MESAAITEYIDVGQLTLYAFWAFFAGLIFYLRREDKREGYPLKSEPNETTSGEVRTFQGFPAVPSPKTFKLADGREIQVPRPEKVDYNLNARKVEPWDGAPLEPLGDPMKDGLGPAAYPVREDTPDRDLEGRLKIAPLRDATEMSVDERDPDPRGMPVIGCDGKQGGRVLDVWADRAEKRVMYLEVEIASGQSVSPAGGSTGETANRALLPINFARVEDDAVYVQSIQSGQFGGVPRLRDADQITPLEEDKICAYYGGGVLYATADRAEPAL